MMILRSKMTWCRRFFSSANIILWFKCDWKVFLLVQLTAGQCCFIPCKKYGKSLLLLPMRFVCCARFKTQCMSYMVIWLQNPLLLCSILLWPIISLLIIYILSISLVSKYLWDYAFCSVHPTANHYNGVIMGVMTSQITSLTIVYSTVYSDADQRNIKAPRHWPKFTDEGMRHHVLYSMQHSNSLITVMSHGHHGVPDHRPFECLLKSEGNPPVTDGFPSQRASNAENVSMCASSHDQAPYITKSETSASFSLFIMCHLHWEIVHYVTDRAVAESHHLVR